MPEAFDLVRVAAVALCLVACGDRKAAPAAGSGSGAVAQTARDAAGRIGPADASGPLVELLHRTKAVVAVSSTVANPKYQPEALVDGDLATAWNSRTGDLAGSWIAFRVPADAQVTTIKLDAGFEGRGPEGDYFPQNHRISRVRITRAGKLLVSTPLDPDKRGLQTIDVPHSAGGDFRIDIAAVVPGTRKTWRETVVSELEVWGYAPAPTAPAAPAMKVGSLDGVQHDPMVGPFPSIESYCDFWGKPIREAVAEEDERCKTAAADDMSCGMRGGKPSCEQGATLEKPAGAFLGARIVTLNNGDGFDGDFPCTLFVRTRSGWYPTEQVGCTSGEGTNVTFDTVELAMHGDKLVWHYTVERDVTGDKSTEDVTVTCIGAGNDPPICTSTPN
jgi:hypothetical protein